MIRSGQRWVGAGADRSEVWCIKEVQPIPGDAKGRSMLFFEIEGRPGLSYQTGAGALAQAVQLADGEQPTKELLDGLPNQLPEVHRFSGAPAATALGERTAIGMWLSDVPEKTLADEYRHKLAAAVATGQHHRGGMVVMNCGAERHKVLTLNLVVLATLTTFGGVQNDENNQPIALVRNCGFCGNTIMVPIEGDAGDELGTAVQS